MKNKLTADHQKFAEVVSRSLPDDLDPITAQMWIENQKSLRNLLRKVLTLDGKIDLNAYPLSVDYKRSVNETIYLGSYINAAKIWSNDTWQSERGIVDVVLKLVYFNDEHNETKDVLCRIKDIGFSPAGTYELLAFGKKYPDILRKFPVVALGDGYCEGQSMAVYRPYLSSDSKHQLILDTQYEEYSWEKKYRFAVVSK